MAFAKRILVATDLSAHASAAYPHARRLGEAFGAELLLAHVHDPKVPRAAEHGVRLASAAEADDTLKAELERIATRELPGAEVVVLAASDVARALCALAEARGVDLIVAATQGASGLKRLLLGSVAAAIVRSAGCPVLTVRSQEAE
jgi:nucleotide-binding universal stress UspA family protein